MTGATEDSARDRILRLRAWSQNIARLGETGFPPSGMRAKRRNDDQGRERKREAEGVGEEGERIHQEKRFFNIVIKEEG